MKIGVTASRHGITTAQATRAEYYLWTFHDEFGATEFHHGDCEGGDVRMAELATTVGLRTVAHRCGCHHGYELDSTYIPPPEGLDLC